MGREDTESEGGAGPHDARSHREAGELSPIGGERQVGEPLRPRTPLYHAYHAERYARQDLIKRYQSLTGARLIVMIDQIFSSGMTLLEDLLFDCDPSQPLHLLLASPGGDGETALRMVRSMQSRCSSLTMVIPDLAKSAATIMCLGADQIIVGPGGDLGPVDPQMQHGPYSLVGAKEIVAAVDEAEARVRATPEAYPLFSGLLADVNMLMVEQAKSALARSGALVTEALRCVASRNDTMVAKLADDLKKPLIDDPQSHAAVVTVEQARRLGLPAESAEPDSEAWRAIWALWTKYFALDCFPAGVTAVYEGERASHVLRPHPRGAADPADA